MPRLLVFLHLPVKQRALQAELQAALATLRVTAVGRVADLERTLARGADAVLTLPPVLEARGLKPRLVGYRGGRRDEAYSLLATTSAPDPSRVASVGAVDLLGRQGTRAFVRDLTGTEPDVERVTKVEDLLPLLQLRRVEAVLLPSRLVPALQTATKMSLVATTLDERVGLPSLALLSPEGEQAVAAVARLPQSVSQRLGVDEWR